MSRWFRAFCLAVPLVLLLGGAVGTADAQTVRTDKMDYTPGERVIMKGHNWLRGERVALYIHEEPQTHQDRTLTVVADPRGRFEYSDLVIERHDQGVLFTVTAVGQTSGESFTWYFTDSGGDFSLDFTAAAPFTYDHLVGGGAYNNRDVGKFDDIVEQLEGGDFACGDLVTFLTQIRVADVPDHMNQTIELILSFTAHSTGQQGVALVDIVNWSINRGPVVNGKGPGGTDAGNIEDGGSNVNLTAEFIDGTGDPFVKPNDLIGVFEIDDLEAGELVVLRVDVRIGCQIPSTPTGNMQARLSDQRVIEVDGQPFDDPIPGGAQTIPFKRVEDVIQITCEVDGPSPVCAETVNTYTVSTTATNPVYAWSFLDNTSGATFVGPTDMAMVDVNSGNMMGSYTLQAEVTDLDVPGADPAICTLMVDVNPLPVVTCADTAFCVDAGPQDLSGLVSPPGGMFSGPGIMGSIFDPSIGPGQYVYTYTYTDTNNCTNSCADTITVFNVPVVTCADTAYCVDAGPQDISGLATPPGGMFSGPGIMGTTFDPSIGAGKYAYTYTFTDASGCSNTCTDTITVNDLPVVTCDLPTLACGNEDAFLLTPFGTPEGGTWSGPGVVDNVFDPAVAGVGQHVLQYCYTDVNGCEGCCLDTLEVVAPPAVTFGAAAFCETDGIVDLSGLANPPGGTFSGSPCVTPDGMLDLSCTGTGLVVITYTFEDANGCANSAPGAINISEVPTCTLAAPDPPPICGTTGNTLTADILGGTPPYTYEWTVEGNGSFEGTEDGGQTLVYSTGPDLFGGIIEISLVVTDSVGCADSCFVEFACQPGFFCTFTQGFYGNPGGKFNGSPTIDIISQQLALGDLVVGKPGRSLTIGLEDAACIVERLPGSMMAMALPDSFGDGNIDPSDCTTFPVNLATNPQGRWKNILLAQTITLGLNLRLNPDLCGYALCRQIKTQNVLPGPDGLFGTTDDLIDPDDPGQIFMIPDEVLAELANNTVCELFDLANCTLAGQGNLAPTVVNKAVDAVNRAFDECRAVTCCEDVCPVAKTLDDIVLTEPDVGERVPTEFALGQNYPNPFNPSTRITLSIPSATSWNVSIYNIAGQLVRRFEGATSSAAFVDVDWDGRDGSGRMVATGVYFYKVKAGSFTDVRKMVLLK